VASLQKRTSSAPAPGSILPALLVAQKADYAEKEKIMTGRRIIELLKTENYAKLREEAELALRIEVAKEKGGASMAQRQRAANKVLGKGRAWEVNENQCFCNGYVVYMLKEYLELPMGTALIDVNNHFRDIPGIEVKVDWATVKIHAIRTKAVKRLDYAVRVGPLVVNSRYLWQARTILGSKDIRLFHTDNCLKPLQLESENGKAAILPIRFQDASLFVDATLAAKEPGAA
jgi:hypothetical protein